MSETLPGARGFWLRWVAANALGEFVGLGAVAGIGFLLFRQFDEPQTWQHAVLFAAVFVCLGALEGLVVGVAQAAVIRRLLPAVRGWVGATVVGAMVAWAVGMVPSTVASLVGSNHADPAPEPPLWLILFLAAGLGAVAWLARFSRYSSGAACGARCPLAPGCGCPPMPRRGVSACRSSFLARRQTSSPPVQRSPRFWSELRCLVPAHWWVLCMGGSW